MKPHRTGDPRPPLINVGAARPQELEEAFRLVFQHVAAQDQEKRLANALNMVEKGELDPAGVVVARDGPALIGAMVCMPVPGASGLIWPPQVLSEAMLPVRRETIEDQLVQLACTWLQQRHIRLAQALVPPADKALGIPLERNGFDHITDLWYLRHDLSRLTSLANRGLTPPARQCRLRYETYRTADHALFHRTLLRTYEATLDCPEVNGVRTVEEIIAGHRAQGAFDPERWWLAFEGDQPVGVLLVTGVPEWQAWDVAYVGVVPERRRHGFGRELMGKALREAAAAEMEQLTLSVDARNQPAWDLYRGLGFEPFDERAVFLAVWS
jgi:ribosomal protein S18 acetylase RimI-like enzyme